MEVHGVLLEEVGRHDHAHVGEREKEFIVLVDRHQGRWNLPVHDAQSMIGRGSTWPFRAPPASGTGNKPTVPLGALTGS